MQRQFRSGSTPPREWNGVADPRRARIDSVVPQLESNTPRATASTETWRDHVRRTFRAMVTARILESKLASLYKAGKIVGGVYIGPGQEAVSGALGASLQRGRDVFAPLIRDQAGRTAFGEELLDATRTYLGSVVGPMRGRDGNVHRGRPEEGQLAMISHLGAMISVVSGMLLARRLKGCLDGTVGATSLGDGATSTGAFHEALNQAAVERLPLVVLLVNNQFAYSTPNDRQFACASLVDRAVGYGVDGREVDGTDLLASLETISGAVQRARDGRGPQLVVANLLRLSGHGEHDDAFYVPEEMKQSPLGRDCMVVGEQQLLEGEFATAAEIAAWKEEASERVQEAVAIAQQESPPDPYQDDWKAFATKDFHPHH